MKIWCDVCSKKEASIFCSADEAALCDDCDSRVHQANKLASKHTRFPLLQPSNSSHPPHCDICQEKKALLFCQQDRAILCRDCDVDLHTANELTQKHDRFVLTGAKLSAKNLAKSDSRKITEFDQVPDFRSKSLTNKRPSMCSSSSCSQTSDTQMNLMPQGMDNVTVVQENMNISEYLMEMLPGWQVEDLLNSSSDPLGFSKVGDDDLKFKNDHFESRISYSNHHHHNNNDHFESRISYSNHHHHNNNDHIGVWVPQAPSMPHPSPFNPGFCVLKNGAEVYKGDELGRKASKYSMDEGFTVPEINPQSLGFKRFRSEF